MKEKSALFIRRPTDGRVKSSVLLLPQPALANDFDGDLPLYIPFIRRVTCPLVLSPVPPAQDDGAEAAAVPSDQVRGRGPGGLSQQHRRPGSGLPTRRVPRHPLALAGQDQRSADVPGERWAVRFLCTRDAAWRLAGHGTKHDRFVTYIPKLVTEAYALLQYTVRTRLN